jgi:TetR/AcrR family transcriptional regulator
MAQPRRLGAEGSQVRARFVDAVEAILREEGYQAVSARQVAGKAGLKTQLLYYYFRTMDDLLLAVVQRVNERRLERFEEALASPEPLRALWELNSDPSAATLAAEITSIANHREAIRAEVVEFATRFRRLQSEAVERLIPPTQDYESAGIVMIASALARTIVTESVLDLTEGHADALAIIERMLARFEKPKTAKRRASR